MGITSRDSEKQDKREANRKLRRVARYLIKCGKFELPLLREISNVWGFGKDGKMLLKKDEYKKDEYKRLLRK